MFKTKKNKKKIDLTPSLEEAQIRIFAFNVINTKISTFNKIFLKFYEHKRFILQNTF